MLNSSAIVESAAQFFDSLYAVCRAPGFQCGRLTLQDFPEGACGDASVLLAKHLTDEGIGDGWIYVAAVRQHEGQALHHAWIELEDIAVDITASQFDIDDGVRVLSASAIRSEWNEITTEEPAQFGIWGAELAADFQGVYRQVREHLGLR